MTYIIFTTNLLHSVFITYWSDMFRPQFLASFNEYTSFLVVCSFYVRVFGRSFTYEIKIKIKTLNSLKFVHKI